ncbi:MAG TPA: NADPH-dependent F420 reductase [Actinomycetota bacterium]|nr:NADPH-dependent F420 reductase [Actinomycetota bacterium]
MDVAIVGGTGHEGFGLALRLAAAGHRVTIGSRDAEKAAASVTEAKDILGPDAAVDGAENPVAVSGSGVVIVTVPFAGQVATYATIAEHLDPGTIVVDATSPLQSAVGAKAWHVLRPWQGSASELAASLVPDGVRVIGAFHTVAASALRDLERPVDEDVLVCGDDADAKHVVGELVETIPGMRWVDCGPLETARITEQLTALLITVNRRYKIKGAGFRISGRDMWGAPG